MAKYLEVLVNAPINSTFTYKAQIAQNNDSKVDESNNGCFDFETDINDIKTKKVRKSKKKEENLISPENILPGMRVEVYFGKKNARKMTAYVIRTFDTLPKNFNFPESEIKPILKILDSDIIFTQEQIELAHWISKYYICTWGEALANMLPSAKKESSSSGFSFEYDESSFIKHELSEEQETAVNQILSKQDNTLHYLYGSTGSGKTEVFLSVAERILAQDKGIIYLVPEIGLTHQVIEAVTKRFGSTVAVLHSGLTPQKKLNQWRRILNREARVVIGARSGVFAPMPDLGLIIIDEEHDGSYKSDKTPRYHARQVAMYRCAKLKIPLIMGSATPSAESYHFMTTGLIEKHTLTKRLAGGKTPDIDVINLANYQMDGAISPILEQEIRTTLEEGRQTILFLNRRGFTHYFRCHSCGFELKCKNCSVPLTYHKTQKILRCHYCGWQIPMPTACPECDSLDVSYSGFGTEFIEDEVSRKFPSAKIQRIDTDTLSNKNELEKCLTDFKNGNIDILLGTQMVAKGLNFPNLKLVGIINADTALHLPDFRSAERAFSLIVQVAGRTGRFFPDGKVILQTYNPYSSSIAFACKNDIDGFYKYELEEREILDFPPFSRLIRLVFRSSIENISKQSAASAAELLSQEAQNFSILGPVECPLSKIAANYRYQVLLKGNDITSMQKAVANLMWNYKTPQGIYIEVDVDPVALL